MKVYILMKNGWPVSVFDSGWFADDCLDKAQFKEPNEHWMLIEFKIQDDT